MHPVRQKIARLMADGRERTIGDIAKGAKITKQKAKWHLDQMLKWRLLSVTDLDGKKAGRIRIYRSAMIKEAAE